MGAFLLGAFLPEALLPEAFLLGALLPGAFLLVSLFVVWPIDIANYGVFCLKNISFYYLTFHITGLPNFWRKSNLKFLGGTPTSGPLKIQKFPICQNCPPP